MFVCLYRLNNGKKKEKSREFFYSTLLRIRIFETFHTYNFFLIAGGGFVVKANSDKLDFINTAVI